MDTDFFEDNANWWNDPESGKANQCPYNTGYSRNNILRDNPLFSKLLPEINKYVATIDGQEASIKPFDFDINNDKLRGALLRQFIDRYLSAGDEMDMLIGKYARALSIPEKSYTTQRLYIMMACRDMEQVNKIIKSVQDLCFYNISTPDGQCNLSANLGTISKIPVTIAKLPYNFICDETWIWQPINEESESEYQRIKRNGIPDDLPYLTITSKNFVHGDIFPESFVSPLNNTEYMLPVSEMDGAELTNTILTRILKILKN